MVSSVIYPDNTGGNRKATYGYGSANGVGDKLSRVGSLAFGGGTVVDYTYYGLGTAVKTDYSAAGINWDLITGSGSDPYAGLDRFGRIVRNLWKVTSGGAALDEIKYGYDRASNRIWRENMVAKAQTTPQYFDELYGYDGAYRLTQTQRGQLAGNPPSSVTNKRFAQAWPTLDPLGNWLSFNEDSNGDGTNDLTQTRAANAVNEITSLSTSPTAWTQPGYDAAGNMTSLPRPSAPTSGYLATYDAWHRLVKLRTDVTTPVTVAEYAYDGLTRRTVKKTHASGTLSETRHFYYSAGWRLLEERIDAGTTYGAQYVWGLRYIDDCVLRDRPSGSERLYVLQDANWNVDALYSSGIVERYAYAPYGAPTVLNADFTVKSGGTGYAWNVLYAGYKWDAESGLFQVRFRYLHPMLGNWVTRDPIGYWGGDWNLYRYVRGNPIYYLDMLGLDDHHWLSRLFNPVTRIYQGQQHVNRLCGPGAVNIHQFTTTFPGNTSTGTAHNRVHFIFESYTDIAKLIYNTSRSCCEMLVAFGALMTVYKRILTELNRRNQLQPALSDDFQITMHPWGNPGSNTDFEYLLLIGKHCFCPKDLAPKPKNPYWPYFQIPQIQFADEVANKLKELRDYADKIEVREPLPPPAGIRTDDELFWIIGAIFFAPIRGIANGFSFFQRQETRHLLRDLLLVLWFR